MKVSLVWLLGASWLGWMFSAHAQSLHLVTEETPPLSAVENGKVGGTVTDKVQAIAAKAGMKSTVESLPWKRAYHAALHAEDTCAYSTARTAERESLFKWVGPIAESEWILYGRADRKIILIGLEDARQFRIGTYDGDVRDSYLRSRGYRVDTAPDDMLNPKKLLAGRIDLWISGKQEGNALIDKNGWDGKIIPLLAINKTDMYLACNKALPDATVERLRQALDAVNLDTASKDTQNAAPNAVP